MSEAEATRPVLAVVPAKATSRRAPGKNETPLAGVPMFLHAVRLAKSVSSVDLVVVSSDSISVLRSAQAEAVRTHCRDETLCQEDVTNFEVLVQLRAELLAEGLDPEIIALLQPTTPFRRPEPLDRMISEFRENQSADSLVTVTPVSRMTGRVEGRRWVPDETPGCRLKSAAGRSALTGHAFLLRPERTLDQNSLLGESIHPVILPESWLDIDVDTPQDLALARQIAPFYFAETAAS
ncbi:cytidylyltransferase domain-containing protein [Algihabitans albus]|uniref:cytidylyltransferase domain-containing protein n=1 Tax=Algihabitans albus TaxID=2164067 RepID=UPI0013C2EB99|nr:hypothetical protein [Algihabitans albus]